MNRMFPLMLPAQPIAAEHAAPNPNDDEVTQQK